MRKRARRSERVRRKNFWGLTILVAVACILIAGAWLQIRNPRTGRDEHGCSAAGPRTLTVIAVDATDVLDGVQRLALQNELTRTVDRLERDDGVQVWRVAPSPGVVPDSAGPLLCNPGKDAHRWFENPRLVERAYQNQFRTPLLGQLSDLAAGVSSPASPIMESVQAIALRTFGKPEYAGVRDKLLVLASDMIQNTPTYSQIPALRPFAQFTSSIGYRKLTPALTGVKVQVLYIQRPTSPQYGEHIRFWQEYFFAAGATLERVVPISGLSDSP